MNDHTLFLSCGIDPETDYPPDHLSAIRGRVGHTAFDRMYGYEHLRNVDALSHIFIKKFYKYETLPQCPDCGSEFLYCDPIKQMCISKDKSSCDIAPVGDRARPFFMNILNSYSDSTLSCFLFFLDDFDHNAQTGVTKVVSVVSD
ncbi:hypothetical protein DPMN_173042 [Dreissena polymorpha]|uniref:Uncharacterized protein n=1 Tax=Dreissena polymorpha TaxID=45954 RepID=A0A9D4E0V4_DREPO|nr:hypothetical protein DPMN_173042 [Dreissena polymorpha]